MKTQFFDTIFSPTQFKQQADQLTELLVKHLEETTAGKGEKAIHWHTPEEELDFWKKFLKNGNSDTFFETILQRTTHTHHPKYVGHQVTSPVPLTALTGYIGSLLNNGMAVYEMGMSPTAMERIVTDIICAKLGWDKNARGFLTSGGTLANLTALLAARKAKASTDVWNQGHDKPLGIIVNEEAHYCIERAAKIMGLGEKGIIKIPVGDDYSMQTDCLETAYEKATDQGIEVIAVVGSAPSTSTGAYDDLEAISSFCKKYHLWLHIDGAHGGAAIFSEKYKSLLHGIEHADSVVIDGHKMMLMPTITTALLFKNGKDSHTTFSQKADYLLTDTEEEDWYNGGKRTFECTKTMMSLHWYALFKFYDEALFDNYVTRQYDLAKTFYQMLEVHPSFETAYTPMSNILCFRYIDSKLSEEELNILNARIRQQLLEDGEFYLVQTKLKGTFYLRTTLMNPFTEKYHLELLLNKIMGAV